MKSNFRIAVDFPALDGFVALGNRYLDYLQAGTQQTIDVLTARIKANTAKTKSAIEGVKQS